MIKLTRTGVGVATNPAELRDRSGTGSLPIQGQGDGATSYRVTCRVSPDAPWVEVIPPTTADFIEAISWCPYVQLEIVSGTGAVTLYIGED